MTIEPTFAEVLAEEVERFGEFIRIATEAAILARDYYSELAFYENQRRYKATTGRTRRHQERREAMTIEPTSFAEVLAEALEAIAYDIGGWSQTMPGVLLSARGLLNEALPALPDEWNPDKLRQARADANAEIERLRAALAVAIDDLAAKLRATPHPDSKP